MRYLLLVIAVLWPAATPAGQTLIWSDLPPLPDEYGFGGPIVGTHDDALIVCGGANFPDGAPWAEEDRPAGDKVWHDRIFVLTKDADVWIDGGRLPFPLAYAAVVSTNDGVYVLGGESYDAANHPTSRVLLLKWNAEKKHVDVEKDPLPPLPKPCQYHNAAIIDSVVYVTASHARGADSQMLDAKSFWSLDLSLPNAERSWNTLKPWPGPAREKMALAVQKSAADGGHASSTCLYMFSGATWFRDRDSNYDLAQFEHFTDAYRFNPKTDSWKRVADLPPVPDSREVNLGGYEFDGERQVWRRLADDEQRSKTDVNELFRHQPRPAAAATAIDVGQSHILLFSGATGRYITLDIRQRPLFPRDVLSYHTITDTWSIAGEMPTGVVTTGVARWNDQIVIPSGEIRPGVRTNQVQTLKVE
jgi:N-acetylneuraminic acid mutarotase